MRVLVTGGTSGLGLAMASALVMAGATVALTGRSGQRANSVAAELPGAVGIELDVRDELSVARAVDQAWSRLGGIDMLVNNAGIGMRTVNPRFMTHPHAPQPPATASAPRPAHPHPASPAGLPPNRARRPA
jgi:gluconate 5-dehydrogenase